MKNHLLSIEILSTFRNLKKGLVLHFEPVTLLVGNQGCGKSSLLSLLQKNQYIKVELSDEAKVKGVSTFYFDSESMNPRTASLDNYSNPNGTDRGISYGSALKSHFMSHGEILREFTVNRLKDAKDCILFFDEPESGLSLQNQFKLVTEINKLHERNVQIIVATHCLPLIESQDKVLNMENRKWMKSTTFIKNCKNK